MVFSSITFLFFFLPAVILVYYVAPRRARNLVLLLASLIFYAWGAGSLVLLLLFSITVNYLLGERIERSMEAGRPSRGRRYLAAAVIVNVGLLVFFKYIGFASASLSGWLAVVGMMNLPVLQILLPIGISFYTFHSISYVVDIYRGTARHLVNPIDYALYISFFPQLIAGPIVRFHEIRDQLLTRKESTFRFARGICRFGHGLAKKVIIADTVAPGVIAVFQTQTSQLNTVTALLGTVGYAVQLYFDFSGYTDMALGIGEMFGLTLPENFNRPYSSRSITEFWRRWHMSLSRWFRDYVYIPLGGNRGSAFQTYRNLIIVFLVTGLWHGANWTFVVWGGYHGVLLLIERARGIGRDPEAVGGIGSQVRTIILVLIGWILFRSPDLPYAIGYMVALFRPGGGVLPDVANAFGPLGAIALAVGAASLVSPRTWVTGVRLERDASPFAGVLRAVTVAASMPVAMILVISGSFSPFLYFKF